jgi:hypothetical protein
VGSGSGVYVRARHDGLFERRDARPFVGRHRAGPPTARCGRTTRGRSSGPGCDAAARCGSGDPVAGGRVARVAGSIRHSLGGGARRGVDPRPFQRPRPPPGTHPLRAQDRAQRADAVPRTASTTCGSGLRGGGLLRVSETPVETGFQLDGMTNDGARAWRRYRTAACGWPRAAA